MLPQKDQEVIILKSFFKLIGVRFFEEKLNLKCEEPADLEYEEQGYQITTGAGKRTGEILASTKYELSDVVHRCTGRTIKIDDIVGEDLKPILLKKKLSSHKSIILVISFIVIDCFKDNDREQRYQSFCKQNPELVNNWKKVYCVVGNKQLIRLFPFKG